MKRNGLFSFFDFSRETVKRQLLLIIQERLLRGKERSKQNIRHFFFQNWFSLVYQVTRILQYIQQRVDKFGHHQDHISAKMYQVCHIYAWGLRSDRFSWHPVFLVFSVFFRRGARGK